MLLTVEGAATRLEGPLLFLRRTLDVGLYDAVEVRGGDGRTRLGRVAAIDDEFMTIEVLESTAGLALNSEHYTGKNYFAADRQALINELHKAYEIAPDGVIGVNCMVAVSNYDDVV